MEEIQEYFLCDNCQNQDFVLVYNFSLRFHGVNFSDSLIYDKLMDELYKCTKCDKKFTRKEVEEWLAEMKRRRKGP